MPHGNSNQNNRSHHLYEIWDRQEEEVFKYGISDDPIDMNGLSKRIRDQLDFLNLAVGWLRFIARILLLNIEGREEAKRIEDERIDAFEEVNGRMPRGNRKRNRKKE
jgi:hypothetical protein